MLYIQLLDVMNTPQFQNIYLFITARIAVASRRDAAAFLSSRVGGRTESAGSVVFIL